MVLHNSYLYWYFVLVLCIKRLQYEKKHNEIPRYGLTCPHYVWYCLVMDNEYITPEQLIDAAVIAMRIDLVREINSVPLDRDGLRTKHGQVWSIAELSQEFHILAFQAPFVVVRRKADGVVGSVKFQHSPRWYFGFEPYDGNEPLESLRG